MSNVNMFDSLGPDDVMKLIRDHLTKLGLSLVEPTKHWSELMFTFACGMSLQVHYSPSTGQEKAYYCIDLLTADG